MADIALVTANRVSVVKSILQETGVAAEAIVAGAPVRIDVSTGKYTNARGNTDAEARVYGIATKTVAANEGLTVLRIGTMDGFALSDMDYDEPVYLSGTDGRLADAAATVFFIVGRVVPGTATPLGTAFDKLLSVELVGPQSTPWVS